MNAVLCRAFGPIDQLEVAQLEVPAPTKNEVRVTLRAAALNFLDTLIVQGRYQLKPELPFVPGAEMAGVVSDVGAGISHVKKGDSVIVRASFGCLAEEVIAAGGNVLKIPMPLDWAQAAALSVTYTTAFHALVARAGLRKGENVLILGAAGGVGSAAIQVAKALGAHVVAACSSASRGQLCLEMGADEFVDYSQGELRELLRNRAGNAQIDVVVDNVGGTLAEGALRALGKKGRYLVIGFASGNIPKFPANLMLLKGASVLGVNADFSREEPAEYSASMDALFKWVEEGRIQPVIGASFPLKLAPLALEQLASRQTHGKVIITPN